MSRQKTDVIWVVGRASPNEVIIHDVMAGVGFKRRFFLMAESFGLKSERKVQVVEMWIVCMYEDPPLSQFSVYKLTGKHLVFIFTVLNKFWGGLRRKVQNHAAALNTKTKR